MNHSRRLLRLAKRVAVMVASLRLALSTGRKIRCIAAFDLLSLCSYTTIDQCS